MMPLVDASALTWEHCEAAEVDRRTVPPAVLEAADRALTEGTDYYQLGKVRVRWLARHGLSNIAGLSFLHTPDVIWVRVELEPAEAVDTVLHELTHLKHHRDGWIAPAEREQREQEATWAGSRARWRFEMGPTTPLCGSLLGQDRSAPAPAHRAAPPAARPAPVPVRVTEPAPATSTAPTSYSERLRRERLWKERYGPAQEAERLAVADARARAGRRHGLLSQFTPPEPLARKRIEQLGAVWYMCAVDGCGEPVQVGTVHRCLVARQFSRRYIS